MSAAETVLERTNRLGRERSRRWYAKPENKLLAKKRMAVVDARKVAKRLAGDKTAIARQLLYAARRRARKLGLPCTIQLGDIQIPDMCPVLGIKLRSNANNPCESSASIDRIVGSLGYVPGNIIVVSFKANAIKSNATPDELERVASFYRRLCVSSA